MCALRERLIFPVVTLLVLAQSVGAQQNSFQAERTIKFPADRSLGILYAAPTESLADDSFNWLSDQFRKLGFAQGSVTIPPNSIVRLDVAIAACRDLGPLADIPADSIQALYFNIGSDPTGQFKPIGSLTGLQALVFRSCPITDDGILELKSLKNLELLRCSVNGYEKKGFGITNRGLKVIANFNRLKYLDLRANPVTDEGLGVLEACDSLETLSLDGTQVTGKGLANLLMLPNLTTVSFGAYQNGAPVDDEGMEVLGQMAQLKSLSLNGTKVTDAGMKFLRGLRNLENLSLDFTEVSDIGLQHLAGLEKLKTIRFQKLGGNGLGNEAAEYLAKVPNLERIVGKWDLTGEGYFELAKLKKLQWLDLEGSASDQDLAMISSMTSLQHLGFHRCPITDQGIKQLAKLNNLEALSIFSSRMTGAGLTTLQKIPNLKRLSLQIEEFGDSNHWQSLGRMTQLEQLNLDRVEFDEQACRALAKLKNLKHLRLENQNKLGSSFLEAVSKLKQLESLNVDSLEASDDDYRKLKSLTKLEYLDLYAGITHQQLMMIADLPSLRIVQTNSDKLTLEGIESFKQSSKSLQSFLHPLTRN